MKISIKKIFQKIEGHEGKIFFIYFFLYFSGLVFFGIKRPLWFDEGHFVDTIKYFGTTPFFQALYNYEEMSMPLPFILFSLWGKLFSFHIVTLRILNIIIASLTYYLMYRFFSSYIKKSTSLLLSIFISLNPYFAGASIFVFTDMVSVLFMIIALHAVNKNSPILLFAGLTGALLSRQYFVFLIPPIFIYYSLKLIVEEKKWENLQNIISILFACVPITLLFLYWKSTCPVNNLKALYINNAFSFHLNAFILYSSQIILYTFPFFLTHTKLYKNLKIFAISFLISLIYIFAPVKASPASVEISRLTVGYLHRAVELFHIRGFSDLLFYAGFLLSIPILMIWGIVLFRKIKIKKFDIHFLAITMMFFFLLIMPLSYLLWEKYFMPALPIVLILFFAERRTDLFTPGIKTEVTL